MKQPTLDDFKHWLRTSAHGARFTYHVGNLGAERSKFGYTADSEGQRQAVFLKWNEPVHSLACAAWAAHEFGQVTLVQTRVLPEVTSKTGVSHARGAFAYIAIRRRARGERVQEVAAEAA